MGYKMKGCMYSPLKQYKTPTIPSIAYGKSNEQDNKELDAQEDAKGVTAQKPKPKCAKCGRLKTNCTCKGVKHDGHRKIKN